ncbi:MAG: UMP kinase, partial [Sulfurovum sp.]
AIALARDNSLPIIVCNMFIENNLLNIINGDMSLCSIVK